MKSISPTAFVNADEYPPETRIQSNFTKRVGTTKAWPPGVVPIIGAVYVHWDDGLKAHAWRHQIHRY